MDELRLVDARVRRLDETKSLGDLALVTAHSQFLSILQQHQVIAMEPRLDFLNEVHVDYRRSMDSQEVASIELLLQTIQSFTNFVGTRPNMQPNVISICLDPIDLSCFYK